MFLGLWEAFVQVRDVRPFILARAQSDIVRYLGRVPRRLPPTHPVTTALHALIGFAIALVLAVLVGALARRVDRSLERAVQPILVLDQS